MKKSICLFIALCVSVGVVRSHKVVVTIPTQTQRVIYTKETVLAYIKKHEGLRLSSYVDICGNATIGYGHSIKPHDKFQTITTLQADSILRKDFEVFYEWSKKYTQNEYEALGLTHLLFSIGIGRFERSALKKAIKHQNKEAIKREWLSFCYANGKKNSYLVEMRKKEFEIFNTPYHAHRNKNTQKQNPFRKGIS